MFAEDGDLLAVGPTFPNQAFRYGRAAYGIQFHPEVTGQVIERWCSEAAHMLAEPGAHDAERQRADAARYDAAMAEWLDDFFDSWLGAPTSGLRPRGPDLGPPTPFSPSKRAINLY